MRDALNSLLVWAFGWRFRGGVLLRFPRRLVRASSWLAVLCAAVGVGSLTLAATGEPRGRSSEHGGPGAATAATTDAGALAEARIGERLFLEQRFAQVFEGEKDVNAEPPPSAMSCATCHVPPRRAAAAGAPRAFCDAVPRSAVPNRGDGRKTTPRNSPSLIDALVAPNAPALLHYDGEFATAEALVAETYTGRNFGWLASERSAARHHFATVIRNDDGTDALARRDGAVSYAQLLRGTSPSIPEALRLPAGARIDSASATDDQIVAACARLVAAYLRTLRFSRDASGVHDGSPYDAFLAANRLPRGPSSGETPREYSRRLSELVFALASPRFIDEPKRSLDPTHRPFRFGATELRGLKIFFKAAVGNAQRSGAGNCAECHVPPQFSDFKFHNSGAAQDEFDGVHGAGAFARLTVPTLEQRNADYDRWLQPTAAHPNAQAAFLQPAAAEVPARTDLGVWNVFANPDLPDPQSVLKRIVDPAAQRSPAAVLATLVGAFKTPGLRELDGSAPYLHTGRAATLDEVVRFYQRMSGLAHAGDMRNAPPEFFAMRLSTQDIDPLVAFLQSLDESTD